MENNTALIVGANGMIGRHLTEYLTSLERWNVMASARTALCYESTAAFVPLDLMGSYNIKDLAEKLKNVTHIFFNAYTESKSPYEQSEANLKLMSDFILAVEEVAPNLKRVLFIQGGKAYGAHLGIYKTPAFETDPRSITPNFYYDQEDFLRRHSHGKKWSWTALRPDIVIGFTVGTPMNLANLIAVYASICKEEGIPIRFPGSLKAYNALVNVTGADVLAKSLEWASLDDKTENEIFNITNGDVFRWSQIWTKIGEYFGIETAEPQTFSLMEYMSGKAKLWKEMVVKYKLEPYELEQLVQWRFGDFIFNVEADAFFDVNKARRFGFHEMNGNTLMNFLHTFQNLKDKNIIP